MFRDIFSDGFSKNTTMLQNLTHTSVDFYVTHFVRNYCVLIIARYTLHSVFEDIRKVRS